MRISLLRFFKTFQKYLANLFFIYFINAMFWPKLPQNRSIKIHNNEIIFQKIALGKYLATAKFGYCNFFPDPKVALGKNPLLATSLAGLECSVIFFPAQLMAK